MGRRTDSLDLHKGSTSDCSNNRPILCNAHIAKLLGKGHLIMDDESPHTVIHSTETSLHKAMVDISEGGSEGLITYTSLFDLAKGFDSIDHDFLLIKLQKYRVNMQCVFIL